jgi:hypothetical protein
MERLEMNYKQERATKFCEELHQTVEVYLWLGSSPYWYW